MPRSFSRFVVPAIVILGLSGCVKETSEGTARVFTYELWLPALALLGGLIAAPAGWVLRKKAARLGWTLLVMGPIAAIGIAPSLLFDRAALDDNSFSLRTGIWGTTVHAVNFDDLNRVRIISEETTGRRGSKRTNYYVMCERKDGTSAKLPLGNSVAEAAAPHLLKAVSERGIPVVDETEK